jgi:hypothetical protein
MTHPLQIVQKAADIQEAISEGSNSFLFTEYKYLGVFMVGTINSYNILLSNPCAHHAVVLCPI